MLNISVVQEEGLDGFTYHDIEKLRKTIKARLGLKMVSRGLPEVVLCPRGGGRHS